VRVPKTVGVQTMKRKVFLSLSFVLILGLLIGLVFGKFPFRARKLSLSCAPPDKTQRHFALVQKIIHDRPDFKKATELERISIIREWVYMNTDNAATEDMLIDRDVFAVWRLSAEENLSLHEQNVGGGWCTDINHILMQVYEAFGYRAWRYDYGIKNGITHSVTLVEVDNDVHMQDAYFNLEYCSESGDPLPFLQVLKSLKAGKDVNYKNGLNRYRDVHSRNYKIPADSWVSNTQGDPVKMTDFHFVHKGNTTWDAFLSKYPRNRRAEKVRTMKLLKDHGFPADITYLVLFPLGIYDGGYRTNPADSKMYAMILDCISKEEEL
jgi:hypothetical protein